MRFIISPAKQMKIDTDSFVCTELPVFTDRAEILKDWIRSLSYEELKTLWACNDKIARGEMVRFMAGIHAEDPEQIKTFAYIAGYTPGGAPYGVRWEDVGIDSERPFEEKVRLYMDQMKDRADTLPVDDVEELPFD